MVTVLAAEVPELDAAACPVSAERLERARRLASRRDRDLSIGAECLLTEGLRRLAPGWPTPPECRREERGKPYIPGCPVHFSLSHSGAWALCALGAAPLGADIQLAAPPRRDIASRFFTPGERRRIASAPDAAEEFIRVWCAKESYIKAVGLGLALPLDSFEVAPEGVYSGGALLPYSLWEARLGGYIAAVCAPAGESFQLLTGRLTGEGAFE